MMAGSVVSRVALGFSRDAQESGPLMCGRQHITTLALEAVTD